MRQPVLDDALVSPEDRVLLRSLLAALALGLVLFGGFVTIHRLYSEKFFRLTGEAQWIWAPHRLASREPVVLVATREFDLPAGTGGARVSVAGDPGYSLYLNGVLIGERNNHDEVSLDRYDVSRVIRQGRNRVVAILRSPNGIGGFLFTLDAGPGRRNVLISDGSWKIYRAWHHDLPLRDPEGLAPLAPMILGRPPMGRWNYLEARGMIPAGSERPVTRVMEPKSFRSVTADLPEKKVLSGVAVIARTSLPATLFDFGRVQGKGRLILAPGETRVVRVRYLSDASELSDLEGTVVPLVIARGEETVTDSETRAFRYMAVFAPDALAVVLAE